MQRRKTDYPLLIGVGICIAMMELHVVSCFWQTLVYYDGRSGRYAAQLEIADGEISIGWMALLNGWYRPPRLGINCVITERIHPLFLRDSYSGGFQWLGEGVMFHGVSVPIWPIYLAAIIWCLRRVFVMRRQRRILGRECLGCGYDLRASSGRCPECGIEIPASEASFEPSVSL